MFFLIDPMQHRHTLTALQCNRLLSK